MVRKSRVKQKNIFIPKMPKPPNKRIYWIDNLKAFAIFFVVLGHTDGIEAWLRTYLYSFHIPLFFFIAGYLVYPRVLEDRFPAFVRHYSQTLIIPYFLWGTVTYLVWFFAGRFYGKDILLAIPPIKPILGMFYGVGANNWLRHNVILWFFPCLFFLHIIFYGLQKYCKGILMLYGLIALSILGCVIEKTCSSKLPWGIETALIALLFYSAGFMTRTTPPIKLPSQKFWPPIIACITLVIQIIGVQLNGRVDMNNGVYKSLILFYLTAFSGIIFWWIVAKSLPRIKLLSKIASETIVIFPLHGLIFALLTVTGLLVFNLPLSFKLNSYPLAALYTITAFGVLLPIAAKFRMFTTWLSQKMQAGSSV